MGNNLMAHPAELSFPVFSFLKYLGKSGQKAVLKEKRKQIWDRHVVF